MAGFMATGTNSGAFALKLEVPVTACSFFLPLRLFFVVVAGGSSAAAMAMFVAALGTNSLAFTSHFVGAPSFGVVASGFLASDGAMGWGGGFGVADGTSADLGWAEMAALGVAAEFDFA